MLTSRRALITAFLGASVANLACRKKQAPLKLTDGALVDTVHTTGHLLRGPPLPRASTGEAVDVLVVGAGAAGLSAAWRLASAGITSLQVLELDAEPGGTARSGKNAVSAFPWGAHYLPAPLTAQGPVPRLLKEMGVLTGVDGEGAPQFLEEALIHEPEERLFFRGHWYEGLFPRAGASPVDLEQLARFETKMETLAAARDAKGRKAFAVPVANSSDDSEFTSLDKLTMAEWLVGEGFTSERLKWFVDYACRDDFGAPSELISAWAGIWYFTARHDGKERNEGYLSWPEGNGRLMQQLRRSVPQLKTNALVHTLERTPNGWSAHAFDAATKTPLRFDARQVVCAAPRFITAHLLEPWRKERPAFLSEFQYGPWAVANLTLSSAPSSRGFPLAWDNVLHASQSLGYVVATHQRLRADVSGPTVITWYYPLGGADVVAERTRLLGTTFDDWAALVAADLGPAHLDLAEKAQRLEVMRWGHAMVRPRPGFLFGPARAAAGESLDGSLHFAHSDLGGLALFEEANHFGVRAAERALAGLGKVSPSWL